MKTVVLDIDDFSPVNSRLELLLEIKRKIPQFKVSMFTIPTDQKTDVGPYLIRKDLLEEVKKHLDWIQIIPHGYRHNGREMGRMSYEEMKETIKNIEYRFNKDGLPFEKGFKSPHWATSPGVVRALDEAGWWLAVDPRKPNAPTTKRFYRYEYPLDDFPQDQELLKLHGHIYGTKNDLGKCYNSLLSHNLMSAEYRYVTDFIENL